MIHRSSDKVFPASEKILLTSVKMQATTDKIQTTYVKILPPSEKIHQTDESADMPEQNPTAYLETLDAFLGHWEDVDAALAPNPLTLAGFTHADLQALRDETAAKATEAVQAQNRREGLATDRDQRRRALRARIVQFRRLVLALDTPHPPPLSPGGERGVYAKNLPQTPMANAGQGVWERALDWTAGLWADIESAPPPGVPVPLLVAGGYGLVSFLADSAALRGVLTDLVGAEQDLSRVIAERDRAWKSAHSRLVQYRLAVSAYFPLSHPLVTSLPRLSAPYRRRAKPVTPEA